MENIEVKVTHLTEKQRLAKENGPLKRYAVGENVVFRFEDGNQIGMITNIRTHKGKRVGYDLRSEKGSGFILVPVDKEKSNPCIDSALTAVWQQNGGGNNMRVDRSIGHTIANFSSDMVLDDIKHFDKNNDLTFPVVGPRSY
jgi:hypothetical protein